MRNVALIAMSAESCAWTGAKFVRTGERFVEILDCMIVANSGPIFEICDMTGVSFAEILGARGATDF
jgi:hypothetical protein